MSEQTTPPEGEATVDTPVEGTDTQTQTNWEDRYKEAQAWGTKNAQRAAELERYEQAVNGLHSDDPDTRLAAAQALGIELEEAPDTTEPEPYLPREEWAQYQAQQQAQERQRSEEQQQREHVAAIQTYVDTETAKFEGLDDDDRDWIAVKALALPATSDGMPNVAAAHEQFVAWENARKQKWATTKRAPHTVTGGKAGTQALDPRKMDHQQRVDYYMERANADQ